MKKLRVLPIIALSFFMLFCDNSTQIVLVGELPETVAGRIVAAGSRSSYYGAKNEAGTFPTPEEWGNVSYNISDNFASSHSDTDYNDDGSIKSIDSVVPTNVWIVGGIGGDANIKEGYCMLEFSPPAGKTESDYENIVFRTDKEGRQDSALAYFDTYGIKVYLQVEAGMADMNTLITLVLDRFGHHECVVGFGIDIEWYPSPLDASGEYVGTIDEWDNVTNEWAPISNSDVEKFDKLIKSYNPKYRLFLKHWVESMVGGSGVSDVIYINDAQGYSGLSQLADEFTDWARTYKNNDVGFQIGYGSDEPWWKDYPDPVHDLGQHIYKEINKVNPLQNVHIYWVDFTLAHDSLDLFEDNPKVN